MREPLTDEQMQELKELWLGRIAITEIRDLRADNAKLRGVSERRKDLIEYRQKELTNVYAKNAKLRERFDALSLYAWHKDECITRHDHLDISECDCGLHDALKDAEPAGVLIKACYACAEGLENDARLFPDDPSRRSVRLSNRANTLRDAIKAATEPARKSEAKP